MLLLDAAPVILEDEQFNYKWAGPIDDIWMEGGLAARRVFQEMEMLGYKSSLLASFRTDIV